MHVFVTVRIISIYIFLKINQTTYFKFEREHAASAEVGGRMVVLGGRSVNEVMGALEIYHLNTGEWEVKEELALRTPRYSFCAAPGIKLYRLLQIHILSHIDIVKLIVKSG